jgi:hypothetical protein
MNTLKIKDRTFKIISASISEENDGERNNRWDISIRTEGKKIDGQNWAPAITGESIIVDAPSLEKIVGEEVVIKEPYDHDANEYLLTMYVFEHHEVWESRIKFLSKRENKLIINWTGKCNIYADDEYDENVPFEINTELTVV